MSNCMIGFPNRLDSAVLSGGSWAGTLPRTNLQDRRLGKVARSADATLASTQFDIDLGAARSIRLLAIVNHNCSLAALMRVRGASDAAFATVVSDSGWLDVWPVVYPSASLEWEDDNWWSGKYTDEQRAGYTSLAKVILASNTLARYWRVELNDTTNAAGFVQLGRVFIGPAWQPANNASYGAGIGWATDTQAQKALSGAKYFQRRTPYRVQSINLDWMTVDEGLANAFELQRRAGIDAEVLWVFDPADTVHALRRSWLGHLRKLDPIRYPYPDTHAAPFEIEELI